MSTEYTSSGPTGNLLRAARFLDTRVLTEMANFLAVLVSATPPPLLRWYSALAEGGRAVTSSMLFSDAPELERLPTAGLGFFGILKGIWIHLPGWFGAGTSSHPVI